MKGEVDEVRGMMEAPGETPRIMHHTWLSGDRLSKERCTHSQRLTSVDSHTRWAIFAGIVSQVCWAIFANEDSQVRRAIFASVASQVCDCCDPLSSTFGGASHPSELCRGVEHRTT